MSFPKTDKHRKQNLNPSLKTELISQLKGIKKDKRTPIVIFDCDGTLWDGDIFDSFLYFLLYKGWYKISAKEFNLRLLTENSKLQNPPPSPKDLKNEIKAIEIFGKKHKVTKHYLDLCSENLGNAWGFLTQLSSGWKHEDMKLLGELFFNRYFKWAVHPTIKELINIFNRYHSKIYLVSGSSSYLVSPAGKYLGLPESHVVGNECLVLANGKIGKKPKLPINWGLGKMERFKEISKVLPHFVFGDTLGDLWVLQAAQSQAFLVNPMSLEAYGAPKTEDPEKDIERIGKAYGWKIIKF